MSVALHRVSAFLFYPLAGSFFVAYLLLRNEIMPIEAAWWLQRGDLPLAFATLLYGGTSFYRSITPPDKPSTIKAVLVSIPLLALFIAAVAMNFWGMLPVPQGASIL